MRIKTAWLPHLHRFRSRELDLIFGGCPDDLFGAGLELGAGDGFQSAQLSRHVRRLTSTDYSPEILGRAGSDRLVYRVCDAEEVDRVFPPGTFDLVFSSNLLEHLPDPRKALRAIHRVLADDGVAIHVMPGPFWKVCHLVLHLPNRLALILERLSEGKGRFAPARLENNPKVGMRKRSYWRRLLAPQPHGAEPTHLKELLAFRRARWAREFAGAGLDLIAILKGPVASGYGFGLDRTRRLLESAGMASEFIYIAVKKGSRSRFEPFLARPGAGGVS